jgi:hypothetical protein
MVNMKRILMMATFGLILAGAMASKADAALPGYTDTNFILGDHPLTINHPPGNTNPWGFVLGCAGCNGGVFDLSSASMTITTRDPSTPNDGRGASATMSGSAIHRLSGQSWNFMASFSGSEYLPGATGGPDPTTGIFDAMEADGYGNGGTFIWHDIKFQLGKSGAGDTLNNFSGPLEWIGKADANGNQSYFEYRWKLSPEKYPDPFYDVFGMSAWLRPADLSIAGSGDIHVTADRQSNPVPEPGTMALLGIGLSGMGFLRRRKTA